MERVKLKDICRLINGRAYKQEELLDSGKYPVLRVGNFFSDKDFYYSDLELEEDKYCDNGDLLFAWSASFGPKIWRGEKVIYHYHIWKMELSDRVNKEFLYYYLFHLSERIKSEGHGGIMIHTTKAEMEEREFNLPTLEEQIAVSEILNKVKSVIDKRNSELAALDNLIKARFVELFGYVHEDRFPKCKLRDVAHIKHGYAFSGEFFSEEDNGVVLVTPGNFALGGGFQEVRNKYFTSDYPDEYVLHTGDLIVTMTDLSKKADTLGYGAIVPDTEKIYLHNQRIGLFDKLDERFNPIFVRWYMQTDEYRLEIVRTSTGSTVHHTSPDRILDSVIFVPPIELQNEFVKFAKQVDKSKFDNQFYYYKCS